MLLQVVQIVTIWLETRNRRLPQSLDPVMLQRKFMCLLVFKPLSSSTRSFYCVSCLIKSKKLRVAQLVKSISAFLRNLFHDRVYNSCPFAVNLTLPDVSRTVSSINLFDMNPRLVRKDWGSQAFVTFL
jgi:hypothetical protein